MDVPADILETVEQIASDLDDIHFNSRHGSWLEGAKDILARAIMAEREREQERDDPVTTVYGRLLWHHMDAFRKSDEPRRERAFATAEALRAIWPAECQVWEDRYTRAWGDEDQGGGRPVSAYQAVAAPAAADSSALPIDQST